jgi:hypothetical protein
MKTRRILYGEGPRTYPLRCEPDPGFVWGFLCLAEELPAASSSFWAGNVVSLEDKMDFQSW